MASASPAPSADIFALDIVKQARLSGSGPLYAQLADGIAEIIASGRLPYGAAMPRVRDLANGLHVSIVTAAHAYRVASEVWWRLGPAWARS